MRQHGSWFCGAAIGALLATIVPCAAGEPVVRPTSGYRVYWQDGDRFVEAAEKVHKSTIDLTLNAHHFPLKTSEGLEAAKAVLDQVTRQIIEDNRKLPQYGDKRIVETKRRDRVAGRVLTRSVELSVEREKRAAVTGRAEQSRDQEARKRQEPEPVTPKQQPREAAQRERRDKDDKAAAQQDAERERQTKERAERRKQPKQESADRQKQPPEATAESASTAATAVPAARTLGVRILPAGADPGSSCNACLQSVAAYATERQLILNCRVDSARWLAGSGGFPLLITLLDRQGKPLEQFVTPSRYTAEAASVGGSPLQGVPVRLKPSWNRLTYDFDPRGLRDAAAVEIGFATPPP